MGGGNTNPGKRFEARFSKSLKALPGASMRLYDGGAYAQLRMPGDFAFWSDEGRSYLIECKATKDRNFSFSKIKKEQLESLLEFCGKNREGIIALNFYGENIGQKNDCYLIHVKQFIRYAANCGRKSIPEKDAARIGIHCPTGKGVWELPFGEINET